MDFDDLDLFCNYCIISSIVRDAKEKTVKRKLLVSILSVLTAIFQVAQNVSIGAKADGGGSDNWSYKMCKALVKLLAPSKPVNMCVI